MSESNLEPDKCPLCKSRAQLIKTEGKCEYFIACVSDCIRQSYTHGLMIDAIIQWNKICRSHQ